MDDVALLADFEPDAGNSILGLLHSPPDIFDGDWTFSFDTFEEQLHFLHCATCLAYLCCKAVPDLVVDIDLRSRTPLAFVSSQSFQPDVYEAILIAERFEFLCEVAETGVDTVGVLIKFGQ